ncbi:MAG TPA: two-component system regulatory protein YycI [Bacillales bacterium]|nr:two-component system regulatory protein YycI [Bacillales bacterium]
MNWSRTKMIFLVAFLALDLFLGFRLYEARQFTIPVQDSNGQSAKDELKYQNITYHPEELPQIKEASYIKGELVSFFEDTPVPNDQGQPSPDGGKDNKGGKGKINQPRLKPFARDLQFIEGKKVQVIRQGNDKAEIFVKLLKPFAISEPSSETFSSELATFLKTYVYQGGEYRYWKTDESTGMYILVQSYKDHPVFAKSTFENGALRLFHANGQITDYKQTYLKITPIENSAGKKMILSPINAIYALFNHNYISTGGEVEDVELSYYNGLEANRDTKIFAPYWHVKVMPSPGKKARWYFVNAVNGAIQVPDQEDETAG